MLSGPNENGFSLWNIATTGWVADLGSAYRRCSALSPDGRTIAACDDTRVRFFDVDSLARGESPRAFGPLGSVTIGDPVLPTRLFPWLYADESRLLYFDSSAKGARLAVSGLTALSVYSRDRRKLHWKGPAPTIVGIEGNAQGITIEGIASSEVTAGALSLDGHDVLLADRTGRIALWDGATGRRRRDVGTHDGAPRITGIAIAPSGAYALSAAVDGSVRYWDLTTNEAVWTRSAGRAYSGAVAISPDGRWYAAVGLREIATDEPARMPTLEGATSHGMALAPDGRIIAAYSTRGTPRRSVLLRYAPDNPEKVDTIAWSGDPAPHLLVTPDGDRILGQSEDGATIQIRNATDGALLVTLHDLGETQWSEWIAITPDNRYDTSANAARHAHWSIGGRWAPLEKHGRRERGLVERALKRPAR
jgi:WD40 repeat protein